jgi:hypothetical protein
MLRLKKALLLDVEAVMKYTLYPVLPLAGAAISTPAAEAASVWLTLSQR